MAERNPASVLSMGRYRLYDAIASGGTAVVHVGRLVGQAGFSRTVAIKRLHPRTANDPEFVAMLIDEARLAARVRHPNVAPMFDVILQNGEVCLVLEYVQGESLSRLAARTRELGERVPVPVARAIVLGALYGLHAAHEATSDDGTPLHVVHRDVSPQNILVGIDGIARVIDFGVAKAAARIQTTVQGELKGKLGYMAPEQMESTDVDARADVFAAGVVLWELLTGARLFENSGVAGVAARAARLEVPRLSVHSDVEPALDAVVMRALAREPDDRFATAAEMAAALAATGPSATPDEVGSWVRRIGGTELASRMARVADIESGSADVGDVHAEPNSELPTSAPHSLPSVSPHRHQVAPPRRRQAALIATVAAISAGVAIGVVSSRVFDARRATPSREASSSAVASDPVVAPLPLASTASRDATQVAKTASPDASAPLVSAATTASIAPSTQSTAAPRQHRRDTPMATPLVPSGSPSARPSYCLQGKQGFVIGSDGIERPRPECL